MKKKREIKQRNFIKPVKANKNPIVIETTSKKRRVVKKGGCCGRRTS
ncbi:hypothetical protein [Halalkalibacter alkalisediminis]|uniref:Uncharacterized protein n=1 Tax=Halalkalibacter alkalisediminis TaxID=935616 RepID=A0ABV6NMH6_9BACI|nr:hypothetical protein [Halalkalibacter alkalisediminis]